MHLLVLGSATSWYIRDLRRAAGGDYQITAAPFSHLASEVNRAGIHVTVDGINLKEFDATLVRTMPPGSLEQVVFRMDSLFQLEKMGQPVFNPPKSLEASIDKYVTTARLQEAGLPVPRTVVCQTVDDAMVAFERLGGDAVVKPVFGGEGRGITRVTDEAVALRVFKALVQIDAALYLQEFIQHDGSDIRLFVLGEQVLGMRRRNPDDWRTNASRGAITEPITIDDELADVARRAAKSVGTPISGVDVLERSDGSLAVLEVNAVPGWLRLAKTIDRDVGRMMLDFVHEQTRIA